MSESRTPDFLPPGVAIEAEENVAGNWGRVFRIADTRLAGERPIRRSLRVFPAKVAETASWEAAYLEKVGRLRESPPVGVSLASEIWISRAGELCILGTYFDQPLSALIRTNQGIERERVEKLAAQSLESLAAIHARRVSHGDVRPGAMYLANENGGAAPRLWLGDPGLGGLTWWSKGEFRHPDSRYYAPPEWQGATDEPNPSADMYAWGVSLCEAALGWSANPNRAEEQDAANSERSERSRRRIARRLVDGGISKPLVAVIEACLEDRGERPQDAHAALDRWRRFERRRERMSRTLRIATGTLALAGIVALGLGWRADFVRSRDRLLETQIAMSAEQREAERLVELERVAEAKIDKLEKRLADAQSELSELAKPPAKATLVESPEQRAELAWKAGFRADLEPDAALAALPGEYEKLKNAGFDDAANKLGEWRSNTLELLQAVRPWFASDSKTRDAFMATAAAPWNSAAHQEAVRRRETLECAARVWRAWALDDERSFGDLESLIDDRARSAECNDVLNIWHRAFLQRKKWTLRPTRGATASGRSLGTERRITVYVAERSTSNDEPWEWQNDHEYHHEGDLEFEWRPNEVIRLLLEGEKGFTTAWARPNLTAIQSFGGPLAPWRLHYAGRIDSEDENRVSLEFEVVDCPGPPREFEPELHPERILAD